MDFANQVEHILGSQVYQGDWYSRVLAALQQQRHDSVATEIYFKKTYEELKILKFGNNLVPGAKYILTDYLTMYLQPYSLVIKFADIPQDIEVTPELLEQKIEPLVLTATSPSTFSPIADSIKSPKDIVFYDFDDNVCEDDAKTPRKGFITKRYDIEFDIEAPYDWRTMLWARFKCDADVWNGSDPVVVGHHYKVGNTLYVAMRYGRPDNNTDPAYFMQLHGEEGLNQYVWSSGYYFKGLTYNETDWAERYTFDNNIDFTSKAPIKAVNMSILRGTRIGTNNESEYKNLPNNIFAFPPRSDVRMRSRINIGNSHNNTFVGVTDETCNVNVIIGDKCRDAFIFGGRVVLGNSVEGVYSDIHHESIYFEVGSNTRNIYNVSKVELADYRFTDDFSGNTVGNNCSDVYIINGTNVEVANDVKACVSFHGAIGAKFEGNNQGVLLGTNAWYVTIAKGVHNRNLTILEWLQSRDFPITLQKDEEGLTRAVWLNSEGVFQTVVVH